MDGPDHDHWLVQPRTIRRLWITFIIVLLGGISSVASDAGYLVLIPLGAAAFASLGRNPIVGIGAAYAGVSAAFFVNILITPADGIITEVTNEIMGGVAPEAGDLNVTHNFSFAIASTLFARSGSRAPSARIHRTRVRSIPEAAAWRRARRSMRHAMSTPVTESRGRPRASSSAHSPAPHPRSRMCIG